jgi:hypothetical protein
MGILNRIKRQELSGFRDFVINLETTTESKRKEIIQLAALEDPLYVNWVLKNMTDVNQVIRLSSDQFEKILKNLPNGLQILARAFYNRPEIDFIKSQVLTRFMLGEFDEYLSNIKNLKKSEQEGAQFLIMKSMRLLQSQELISGPHWYLPPIEIMREDKMKSISGIAEVFFENGNLAARGEISKNQREGHWEHFFENGKLMAEGEYDQGQKSGKWSFWYVSGKIKSQGEFKNDMKHGTWKEYDSEGIVTVVEFEEGKRL